MNWHFPAKAWRAFRSYQAVANAYSFSTHPLVAFLIPTRQCNLACGYCNEYVAMRNGSPVPLPILRQRIDHLARFWTSLIILSGGEPLVHPQIVDVVRYIRRSSLRIAGLITNGFLLTPDIITRLNEAGLDGLQISIDNVHPDTMSVKSLKTLDVKLRMLCQNARFSVNINSVLGSGVASPEDVLVIMERAQELGFSFSLGLIHDHSGQLRPLNERERAVYDEVNKRNRSNIFHGLTEEAWDNLVEGRPNDWSCRAGGRYLYVDEDGIVSRCSQQRHSPGIPLEHYTLQDVRREYLTPKPCAPWCTVGCVHRISSIDSWRDVQTDHPTVKVASTVLYERVVGLRGRMVLEGQKEEKRDRQRS